MPQLIYINDTYCATFEQLKSLLADDRNQKESGFRKEILSYYRDGILQEWLEALGKNEVKFSLTESTDNETFKSIVKAVTGQEIKGDILSKFNEVGEFLRLEYDGKTYEKSNETIKITNFKTKTIKFIFRCLKPENNVFKFSLNDNVKSLNWNDFNKNQEVAIEFDIANEGDYSLIEGNKNEICKVGLSSITEFAVDLGLSVYWADRDLEDCSGNIKENIINEFGKGWRLPTADEARELLNAKITRCSKSEEIDIWSRPHYYWLFCGNNNTIQLEYSGYLLSDGGYFCTNTAPKMGFSYQNRYNFEVRPVHDK